MKNKSKSLVGVIMGSKSDWKTMIHCSNTLKEFKINEIGLKVGLEIRSKRLLPKEKKLGRDLLELSGDNFPKQIQTNFTEMQKPRFQKDK